MSPSAFWLSALSKTGGVQKCLLRLAPPVPNVFAFGEWVCDYFPVMKSSKVSLYSPPPLFLSLFPPFFRRNLEDSSARSGRYF